MRKIMVLCILAACIILNACGKRNSPYSDFQSPKYLEIRDSIDLEVFGILNPHYIYYLDSFLIFNRTRSGEIQFLDLKSNVVSSRNIVGPGPNEMTAFSIMPGILNSSSFRFMDRHKGKIYEMNLDELRKDTATAYSMVQILPMPEKSHPIRFIENKKAIYGTGVFLNGRIYRFDKQKNEYKEMGEYPMNRTIGKLDMLHRGALFSGTIMRTNSDDSRLVTAFSGLLDFYKNLSDSLVPIKKHYYHFPRFRDGRDGHAIVFNGNKHISGFLEIDADDRYVYTCYSSYSIKQTAEDRLSSCDLFVYDWDGNPVIRYTLPHQIDGIAVHGKTLYTLCREKDPIVYCYNLEP